MRVGEEYNGNRMRGGVSVVAWEDSALWLVQSYWVIWLVFSAVVAMVLGAVILRNYQEIK